MFYYVGNWKRSKRDGYGVQESYGKLGGGGDAWLTTVLDGSWKEDKFHGWGRLLEFKEMDELLGLAREASTIDVIKQFHNVELLELM